MTKLQEYMQDGAAHQARAVLCYLQGITDEAIDAVLEVSRWHNCREQGYILSITNYNKDGDRQQLNIAFFEHRNSDSICSVEWYQLSTDPITISSAHFGEHIYRDKYDVTYSVGVGAVAEMAEHIVKSIEKHLVGAELHEDI